MHVPLTCVRLCSIHTDLRQSAAQAVQPVDDHREGASRKPPHTVNGILFMCSLHSSASKVFTITFSLKCMWLSAWWVTILISGTTPPKCRLKNFAAKLSYLAYICSILRAAFVHLLPQKAEDWKNRHVLPSWLILPYFLLNIHDSLAPEIWFTC